VGDDCMGIVYRKGSSMGIVYRKGSSMRLVYDEIKDIRVSDVKVMDVDWLRFNCISIGTFRCCLHHISKCHGLLFKTKRVESGNIMIKRID
jgi:hypothetical protein